MTNKKYIVRNPYKGTLQKPELVTVIGTVGDGYFSLREYPENGRYAAYEVCVPSEELFDSALEAYEDLTNRLIYKIKQLNRTFKNL